MHAKIPYMEHLGIGLGVGWPVNNGINYQRNWWTPDFWTINRIGAQGVQPCPVMGTCLARNFDLVPIVFEKIQLDQSPVATRKRSEAKRVGSFDRCFFWGGLGLCTWICWVGDFYFLTMVHHHLKPPYGRILYFFQASYANSSVCCILRDEIQIYVFLGILIRDYMGHFITQYIEYIEDYTTWGFE